jgi:prolyl 4-hydroxylase
MVLYCNEPGEGGATTFTNADVYVRPKKGFASFFSYMDEQGLMDPLMLSQHSGCPVTQGEKWIATQWLRRGVDKDNPWFHFEPSGTEQVPS